MYFLDDEHKQNYQNLMELYNLKPGQDIQYEPTIYISGIPEIYKCFKGQIDTGFSPLYELMEWNDEKEKHLPASSGLTGSTSRLIEFGLSCYNNHQISMDDILGSVTSDEYFQVLIQTMKIRSRK